jgi:AcrR family transcriptional regulator
MAPTNTKDRIVGASAELFRRQGYSGTGVKQILAEASAPFGSLYHHFPGGKEQLGAETIRRSGYLYGRLFVEIVGPAPDLLTGIGDFFAGAADTLVETGYADACPIATVALEVSSTSEPMREACADVFNAWIDGATIRFTQEGIAPDRARTLALVFLSALEGAFVLARALRSTEPLRAGGDAVVAALRDELARE